MLSYKVHVDLQNNQGVVRCQSFALIGVAGSLVGSVPCFLQVIQASLILQLTPLAKCNPLYCNHIDHSGMDIYPIYLIK
jgi:hypothetical protein